MEIPQVSLGWASLLGVEYDNFPFTALTLLVGQKKGHLFCKKLGVGLLVTIELVNFGFYDCSCRPWLQ